jgi:hypothetical protein
MGWRLQVMKADSILCLGIPERIEGFSLASAKHRQKDYAANDSIKERAELRSSTRQIA